VLELDISTLNGEKKDLSAPMDLASAVHAYGATPPAWMNKHAAVEPFFAVEKRTTGNISAMTSVYSAKLDCRAIPRKGHYDDIRWN